MESIENACCLMALQHGIMAVTAFAMIFPCAIVSHLFALKAPLSEPLIGFSFAGNCVMCFDAFSTVYGGSQIEPMRFLLLGCGESIKRRGVETMQGGVPPPAAPAFHRVMN